MTTNKEENTTNCSSKSIISDLSMFSMACNVYIYNWDCSVKVVFSAATKHTADGNNLNKQTYDSIC